MDYTETVADGGRAMVAHRKEKTSLAEFLALPNDENMHEFVRGEIRVSPIPKGSHGWIESIINGVIYAYLTSRARDLGWLPEQGLVVRWRLVGFVASGKLGIHFTLPDDPDQVRGVDVAYIPAEQYVRSGWDHHGYFPAVPGLVVEVITLSDEKADIEEKRRDYLVGGAQRLWTVYPVRAEVHIHDPYAPTRALRLDDTLTDEELLPSFALPLRLIFPPAP